MNKIKSRKIKVENLSDRNIVYSDESNHSRLLGVAVAIILVLSFLFLDFVYVVILIFAGLLIISNMKDVVSIEICDDKFIFYEDDEYATIIYFSEIVNYNMHHRNNEFVFKFLLDDDSDYTYKSRNALVESNIKLAIGELYVGK